MLHFYEHTICVNGITGASHTPASILSFPLSRTPVCLPVHWDYIQNVTASDLSSIQNKPSSSFILYHFEACQTLNRQLCGSGCYLRLVTSLYACVSSSKCPDIQVYLIKFTSVYFYSNYKRFGERESRLTLPLLQRRKTVELAACMFKWKNEN